MPGVVRQPRLVVVGLAFFLSGAAALAYQVAWQRLLALQTGVGLYSIAVIVAAFMLGLGLGSPLGASASARVSPSRALALFAACELAIAAFGASSCTLYYDWLYVRWGWIYGEPLRAGLLQFASLALPTILMGMSLPFLTRAMVRDAATASQTIGFLYAINVLGAAAGALATPWVFIRHHGIRTAVMAAVAANVIAGLCAVGLALASRSAQRTETGTGTETETGTDARTEEEPRSFRTWLLLYALSGLCALALEILWFRVLDVALKSTAFTFGTLLTVYLLGSGAGAFVGVARVRHLRRPLRTFLALQCALLLYAGGMLALVTRLPADTPYYHWFYEVWGGTRSFNLGGAMYWARAFNLYVVLPLVLFGPPTLLMGLSFPVLQRAVQDDPATSGWKTGVLQAANIAGCVVGSLLVGLVSLTALGTPGTMRALLVVGLVFAGLGLRAYGARSLFLPLAAGLVVAALALPARHEFWMRFHGTAKGATLLDEDATGVAALIPGQEVWQVWSGGRTHSSLPFGGIHTTLGAAPAILHPAPRAVAIIGLGSGDTAASAGCRRDVEQHVTVFEIFAPQRRLLGRLMDLPDPPARLGRFLGDPRFTIRIADGRNALDRDGALYDLIEADALWPTSPYAGNLYSLEFFQLCARRLSPGGLVTTWAPTDRVRATFRAALPYVVAVAGGNVLIGSGSPIPIEPEVWRSRLFDPQMVAYLGPPRVNGVWAEIAGAQALPPAQEGPLNLDLFPRDEFHSPD
ncbi:MAG TPA: fused MFS/spermidine synthase [Vicinamibacteria bacterium]|nr:fused MFS/spermidine synthase [Vicinamibacteria bacterium]